MRKIFPIKVEKATPQDYKFVEWKIHNVCNYNCSFCGTQHKDGSNRWFDIDTYKLYADKILNSCGDELLWLQFTGGEPTLFPDLLELMGYIKSKGAYVSMISNGSRTLRWWKELKESKAIDYLTLTYHTDMTKDYTHIIDILNLFHDQPVLTECLVTHTKNTIDIAFTSAESILDNTGAFVTVKAMMIGDYDIYSFYTEEQLIKLKEFNGLTGKLYDSKTKGSIPGNNYKLKVTYDDYSEVVAKPQVMLKNRENDFKGWNCDVGTKSMRIDHDTIYRGVCEVGGPTYKLSDPEIKFQKTSVVCNVTKCFCNTDMIATKIKSDK